MSDIIVSIRLIDGGFDEYTTGPGVLEKLKSLQQRGFSGRLLIENLITGDWGAQTTSVVGILQEELAAEARKYAAAMQRAQDAGNKAVKLSAGDSLRLTQELYDHQKNIQALNSELRRTRSVQ